jgi:gamma-glutamyl-gamma-aminobutyrate hydrolase PuuD
MSGPARPILVTQRVVVDPRTGERRDALDQRWPRFLRLAWLIGITVPNVPEIVPELLAIVRPCGVLLTGGNDLVSLGGDAPERDATEDRLLEIARSERLPLLGVCRGMQVIQHKHGVHLSRVEGHVAARQTIDVMGRRQVVNSYHNFGTRETSHELKVCARADDGVVKMVQSVETPVVGIMWHPERCELSEESDIALFKHVFEAAR